MRSCGVCKALLYKVRLAIPCVVYTDGSGRASAGSKLMGPRNLPTKGNGVKEIVMAKVIQFYIPTGFRKPVKLAPQPQSGKLIEFCLQTRKSA